MSMAVFQQNFIKKIMDVEGNKMTFLLGYKKELSTQNPLFSKNIFESELKVKILSQMKEKRFFFLCQHTYPKECLTEVL